MYTVASGGGDGAAPSYPSVRATARMSRFMQPVRTRDLNRMTHPAKKVTAAGQGFALATWNP